MKQLFVVFAVLGLLVIAGCSRAPVQAPADTSAPTTTQAVSEFEDDLSEVDSLDSELDTSELDSLDQDLATLG